MTLPVKIAYLESALEDGCQVGGVTLTHHSLGDLSLPTGQLVASDPFVCPEQEAFTQSLLPGTYPVTLSIAQIDDDQRLAFAILRVEAGAPVTWEMLTVGEQDPDELSEDEFFGYPVDAGTGCFMDRSVGKSLTAAMDADNDFCDTLFVEMEKTYRNTWSWLNHPLGAANLIAFSTGYGDGRYATYAGLDVAGKIVVIVTDFGAVTFV